MIFSKPNEIALNYTLKCNFQCRHCCRNASPQRKEKLSKADAERVILQAKEIGIKKCYFTGGEALLFYDEIIKLINLCKRLKISTSIGTNAYWAGTYRQALDFLRPLVKQQLSNISISLDMFHLEYTHFINVANAVNAASVLKLDYKINICFYRNKEIRLLLKMLKPLNIHPKHIFVYYIYPVGRAKKFIRLQEQDFRLSSFRGSRCCIVPVIEPTGDISACCLADLHFRNSNNLFNLGNVIEYSLKDIFAKLNDSILFRLLHLWGIYGVYYVLVKGGARSRLKVHPFYQNKCELCRDLLDRDNSETVDLLKEALKKKKKLARQFFTYEYISERWAKKR